MEESRSSSKSLRMHEIQQPPRCQMHATGQSIAPQSAWHQFHDRDHDNADQARCTWQQGRRLEELRIRYLARKFFCLWAKKSFGQVLPSKARHLLLYLIFKAWRAYVCQQHRKRNKYNVAESHAKKQQLLRTWQCWLVYVDVQRTKHGMESVAVAFRERSCLRMSWVLWRRRHHQNCAGHKMNVLALQHWAQNLQFRAWLQWRELCLYSQNVKQKETRAVTHHQQWELKRCMQVWLGYLNLRRAKRHQNDVVLCAEETRRCQLAEKHYKHQLLVLQKFWNRWKSCLEEKEEEQQQALTSLAHAHFRRVLMNRVFDTWLLKATKQQEYRMGEKKAVLHFERQLLRCFWCLWHRRTAAHLEEQEGLVRARDHHNNLLLLKAFCLWKQNTQQRRTERLKEVQVLRFHNSKCLQQTWNKWRKYLGHQQEKWRKLMLGEMHYQRTLLGKTLAAWKSYQQNIQCILYYVAEKEEQRTKLLLRQLLRMWKENVLAVIHEAEATSEADEHYRRAILSKVLLQWRSAALQQEYCRQQKRTAMMEARKHLNIVRLQTLFLRWKKLTMESLMLRVQQHRAVQHQQQHLLQKYLVKWKEYHQRCLGRVLLRRQGDQLMTRRLCSASFSCWKTRLLQQQWEKQKTVQGLWHWSLSLQRKVFDAWLGFALGQQQKKGCTEKAMGVSHTAVLREGASWDLRRTTGVKLWQGQLQAQHQLKKKQVTFEVPDVSPETRGHSAEEQPWPSKSSHPPFYLAGGDSVLGDLNAIQRARLPPRRPDFLLESLESRELLGPPFPRSEAPFQRMPVSRCSAPTGGFTPAPQMETSTRKCLSPVGSTTHSYPSPPRTHGVRCTVQGPEPWSPSFIPHVEAGAESDAFPSDWPESTAPSKSSEQLQFSSTESERGTQPVSGHKGACSQGPQQDSLEKKLRPSLQPRLQSPEDFVGKWSRQTAGEKRELSSRAEMVLQRRLEAELQHIQQQMQYYFSRKQELKSCQQQAQILQKWLDTSRQPKDKYGAQGAWAELDQLQVRIDTLTKAQPQDRHHVQNLVARLHDIQIALDMQCI